MGSLRRIPLWIALLIALDIALVVAPAINFWLGSPFAVVRNLLDLDSEHSLPAWYSSMQWFCAGVLFGVLVFSALMSTGLKRLAPGFVPMAGLALLCVAFSADEIVAIHEWVGKRTDALLPGGDRSNTALWRSGFWPMLVGIPMIVLLGVMLVRMRKVFLPAPGALRLLIAGLAIMFAGALLVELAGNFIDAAAETPGLVLLQLVCEEFLEMLGVSVIVWSACDLLRAYGFELRAPDWAAQVVETRRYCVNPAPGRTMLSG